MATPDESLQSETGFTLIELLVVILIIGILAAIAIPTFLSQRSKGYAAQVKSDLRNFSSFEEIYLNDFGSYGSITQIESAEPKVYASRNVTISVTYLGAVGYCLMGQHAASSAVWYFDSQAGGLQPAGSTGCPSTTTGSPGGTLTG